MTIFSDILSTLPVERLGWTLLHSLWQFAVIGFLLWGMLAVLQHRSANVRYLVACFALLAMLAGSAVTFYMLPDFSAASRSFLTAQSPGDIEAPSSQDASLSGTRWKSDLAESPSILPASEPADAAPEVPVDVAKKRTSTKEGVKAKSVVLLGAVTAALTPWMPWITLVWLSGVVVFSARNLVGWTGVQRLRCVGTAPVGAGMALSARSLIARMKIGRSVRVLQSVLVEVPLVIGWLRPIILLPASILGELSPVQLEAILAHELAHIRRHDYLVNLLQTVAETLLFYHPAVWWVSRRIRTEREHCCDDVAVGVCGGSLGLGEALTLMAAARLGLKPVLAASGNRPSGVIRRLQRLLDPKAESLSYSKASAALVVFILLGLTVTAGWSGLAMAGFPTESNTENSHDTEKTFNEEDSDRQEIPMQWHSGGKAREDMPAFGGNIELSFTKIPPAKYENLPGADVRFSKLVFDDDSKSSFVCGISKSSKKLGENLFDTLFIDIDGDKKISPDEILRGKFVDVPGERLKRCYYGFVRLPLTLEKQKRRYGVYFSWNSWPISGTFYAQTHCYTQGKALLGGKSISAVLVDRNLDGRFNTASPSERKCDYVWLDLNRDNELQWNEHVSIGGYLFHGGRIYFVTSSADGTSLSLSPFSGKRGLLQLPFSNYQLELRSSHSRLRVSSNTSAISLPEDTYALGDYVMQVPRPDGQWQLRGGSGWLDKPWRTDVQISSEKAAEVSAGPPLVGKIEVKANPRSGSIFFTWMALGTGGERVSASGPGGACPLPPKLEIRNDHKKLVLSTMMGGGCGGSATYQWIPSPETPPGRYTAHVVCESWPLPVRPADCSFKLGSFPREVHGEKIAQTLNQEEQNLLKTLVTLNSGAGIQFPNAVCEPVLYHIHSEREITEWKIRQFRHRDGKAKWGSSELAHAQADYYLLDGTRLKSVWKPRGNGMHDIWIDVGKNMPPSKKIELAFSTRYNSDDLLMTQDRKKMALRFYTRKGSPTAIIVRVDKPFDLGPWSLSGAELQSTEESTQLTWLLPASPEERNHLVWFTGPFTDQDAKGRNAPPVAKPSVTPKIKPRDPTGAQTHIEGRVTDAAGKPIAGALLEWGHYNDPPEKRQRTTTDAQGCYRLDYRKYDLDYRLSVSAPGKAPQWKIFYQSWLSQHPPGGKAIPPKNADFQLEPAHRIQGIVVDEQERPIPKVRIQAQTARKSNEGSTFYGPTPPMPIPGEGKFETITDADGRFQIEGLPAEEVQLDVTAPYRHVDAQNYPVDQECRIVMSGSGRPGVVRGRVVDAETGKPVQEFRVVGRSDPKPRSFTSADGWFEWDKKLIEGDTYTMYIYGKDYAPAEAAMKIFPLDGKEETVVKLPRGVAFLGRLVDAQNGKPIAHAPLMSAVLDNGCEYIDWGSWEKYVDGFVPPWSLVQRTETDDDGNFWFSEATDRPQGILFVLAPGYGRRILRLADQPDKDQSDRVKISVNPEASVSGVLLKEGRPQAGVAVTISRNESRTDGIAEHFEEVATDSQGRYHIGNLAPGAYCVSYASWPQGSAFYTFLSPIEIIRIAAGEKKVFEPVDLDKQTSAPEQKQAEKPNPHEKAVSGKPARTTREGNFAIDKALPVGLRGAAGGKPDVLRLRTIRFEKKNEKLRAELTGKMISWPKRQWRVETALLDEAGKLLAKDEKAVENSGFIRRAPMIEPLALSLDFGPAEKVLPLAKRFRVTLLGSTDSATAGGKPIEGEGKAKLDFLADFPEFHELDLNITEKKLQRIIAEKGLRSSVSGEDQEKRYHVFRSDGENVIVMFNNDGKCSGVQRMRKDAQNADKLFNELTKNSLAIEARVGGVDGKPADKSSITFWEAVGPEELKEGSGWPMPGGDRSHVWNDSATGRTWRPIHHYGQSARATKEDLSPGEYRVTARVGHRSPESVGVSDVIRLDGSRQKTAVTVKIEEGPALAVQVVDQKTGKAIELPSICLIRPDGLPVVRWSSYWNIKGNQEGAHTFKHLAPGKYTLEVTRPAFYFGYPDYVHDAGPIDVALEPGRDVAITVKMREVWPDAKEAERRWPWAVTGTVTDADGKPIEGAAVRASCGIGTLMPTGHTATDAQGKYLLRFRTGVRIWSEQKQQWRAGFQPATVSVSKPGFFERNLYRQGDLSMADEMPPKDNASGTTLDKIVLPHKPHRLDFVMVPAASVRGGLIDARGKPIANQRLSVKGEHSWPSTNVLVSARTDAQGKFQVDVLPTGQPLWFEYGGAATDRTSFAAGRHVITLKYSSDAGEGKAALTLERSEL